MGMGCFIVKHITLHQNTSKIDTVEILAQVGDVSPALGHLGPAQACQRIWYSHSCFQNLVARSHRETPWRPPGWPWQLLLPPSQPLQLLQHWLPVQRFVIPALLSAVNERPGFIYMHTPNNESNSE